MKGFFRRSELESEIDSELRSHIELRADDLERSGLVRAEAERQARIEFGGQARFREESREAAGGVWIETLLHDIRFSFRVLRKSPGFTCVAVATLAFAIGANAVVFGILNGLILRPIAVPDAHSIYGLTYADNSAWQSYPNYRDLRDRNRSFDDLAAFNFAFVGLDAGNNPVRSTGFAVTGNYFDVLQLRPFLGRLIHPSDERGIGSAPYLVLSHAYWHSHFGDDRGVVGRTVLLNKHPFTVIGVAPPEFRGTVSFISSDFFVPIVNQEQLDAEARLETRGDFHAIFEIFGRFKSGVTLQQASADVKRVGSYLERTYPKEFFQNSALSLEPVGFASFGSAVRMFVSALMLLAGLILIAACANLGGLFTARAADRSREVALRLALGSSRGRILRQLLTESVLVSLAGGAVGLWASILLLERFSQWQPFSGAPVNVPVHPDARVYLVALALAIVSGLLFGIIPVHLVFRTDPYQIVKSGSLGAAGRRVTVRDVLLVAQIAVCAVLVTSSMVAVRGLMRSLRSNFGFEPRLVTLAGTNLSMAGYKGADIVGMQKRIIAALETVPGVEHVGLANNYPPLVYASARRNNIFKLETSDLRPSNIALAPYRFDISPGYFEAAGTKLLAGRTLSWHDDQNAPLTAVVNREFANRMFGSVEHAIGRYYKLQEGSRVRVVGVAEDGKYLAITEDPQPAMFLPFVLSPATTSAVLIRSTRDPQQIAEEVRNKVRELDAGLPVEIETWQSKMGVALFPARVATGALGVLGLMGAVLSITGIFGMAAYSVSKRLKELGIRMALGAQRREVLQAALSRAFKLLAFGSCAGLLLGLLAARVLAAIVYQATPRDPIVLAGVVIAMATVGLLATWIPAQRALTLDPAKLLRDE